MRAAILSKAGPIETRPLAVKEIPMPVPARDEALLQVLACGVCHTDLHIVEGELRHPIPDLIPGHQIVAKIVESPDPKWKKDARVGVSWIGGTDGSCSFCTSGRENLCDHPTYTGYNHQGGFAEYTTARTDFLLPLPDELDDQDAAPLLCAGIIGFRSLRIAEAKQGQKIGLFGFGASAQLIMPVLRAWDCKIYVSTREPQHRQRALEMGADWAGQATEVPPYPLDCAVTFAPSGDVVISALRSLNKGGILAINAIHLDRMPEFDYDTLLWGERQIRSVTNMTRQDAHEYLATAARIGLKPEINSYSLDRINEALLSIRKGEFIAPAVVVLK